MEIRASRLERNQQILSRFLEGLSPTGSTHFSPQLQQQLNPYLWQTSQDLQQLQQYGALPFPGANYMPQMGYGDIPNLNGWAQNLQMYILDMRQAISTMRQTQLELRKMDENDRANLAKLLNSINDISFGIVKDRMASANKQAEAMRSLL